MTIKKVSLILLFLIACILGFPTHIKAENEFATSYDITYNVNENGNTTTLQTITMRNVLDHIYATEYSIIIGSTNIKKIKAYDNFGQIDPEIVQRDNTTRIDLDFEKNIIGKNKIRTVNLSYDSTDFATVKGQVLEIGFPILANSEKLEDYQVTINIPKKFGIPTEMIPTPYKKTDHDDFYSYIFLKSDLQNIDGISATFGTYQILKFNIKYNLENKNSVKAKTEIALPADTNYQQVIINSLNPQPENVTIDLDGNWLADYILSPNEKITIEAQGFAKLFYFPREEFARDLTQEEIKEWTKSDEYWQADDAFIKDFAQKYKTPKEIYEYLVATFDYNYKRLNQQAQRFGAVYALQNPTESICMEFTDAFITLARANGIPSREHNGFAYTQNSRLRPTSEKLDILHSWPEYYDSQKKQWIQVDPTWGKTTGGLNFFDKFDLDHFSFVIHGKESNYPVTAGSYKREGEETKDIEIKFGENFEITKNFEFSGNFNPKGLTGVPLTGYYKLINIGNSAIYNQKINEEIWHNQKLLSQNEITFFAVPPFGRQIKDFKYQSNWNERGGNYSFLVKSENTQKNFDFYLQPILDYRLIAGLVVCLLLIILFIIIKKIRRKNKEKEIINQKIEQQFQESEKLLNRQVNQNSPNSEIEVIQPEIEAPLT